MSGDGPRLSRAMSYINKSERLGGFGRTSVTTAGGIVVAIGASLISFNEAATSFVTQGIFDPFQRGTATGILAFTQAPGEYVRQAFTAGAQSFGSGVWSQFGPFIPWLGMIVALGVYFGYSRYMDANNSDAPGTGLDLPVIGNDSDGEDD